MLSLDDPILLVPHTFINRVWVENGNTSLVLNPATNELNSSPLKWKRICLTS